MPLASREARATTVVYPDTLDLKNKRYSILPAMRPIRKTVGLALSGGGANGLAQIGVLKAFEEESIPIDYIAGTSIGALVGGLYSSGYSAADLETIVLSLPWSKIVSLDDDTPRANSYIEQKYIRDRASIVIRFNNFKLVVPKSLSSAQTLTRTVDLLILNAPYHTTDDFSDLPVTFRAITTDLVSGRRVTLTSGTLSEAMRASSTIPILYQPIERNGHKLVDGGLVANLPVDELDAAGAEYKVAVDSHGKMYTDSEEIDIPWKAADQAMTILTQVQYPLQLERADIVVSPDLDQHKATDFSGIRQLIDAGYAKGKLLASTIRRSIQTAASGDTNISRYTKTVRGIPDNREYLEQMRTAKGVIRNASQLKTTLHDLLATDLFTGAHAELDETNRRVVFVLAALPRISKVEIQGSPGNQLPEREMQSIFAPLTGKLYTNAVATKTLEELIRRYRRKGYSLVSINKTAVTLETLQIWLTEGKIDTISIEQDRHMTKSMPIMREIAVDTTKAFSLKSAEQTIDNLYGTGVFNRVSLSTESSSQSAGNQPTTLTVKLVEKPATVLRLGLRYDDTYNAQMLIDLRNENVAGSTNSIGGWAKISQKNNHVNLEFSVPRIGRTPLTMFSSAFFDQRDIQTRQLNLPDASPHESSNYPRSYGVQRYGLTTAFGTRIQKDARLVADLTLQNARSYVEDRIPGAFNTGDINLASFGAQFTLDTRDSSFLPSEGHYMNVRYGYTPKFLSDSTTYWQFKASLEDNFTIRPDTVLQLTAVTGASSTSVPFSEKFFLGGLGSAYSFRFIGLKENDLIGNNIMIAGTQLRYKSPVQIIFPTSLIAAYNIGNVWEERHKISTRQLVQGIGAGLVWETPVGPARFTVSKSFAFEGEDVKDTTKLDFSETILYFSLGHDF